jgi:hypothetical protein
VIRSFALFAAILLLVLPAFWLFEATVPVDRFRARDYTDFAFFAAGFGVLYGGVALGVAIHAAQARASGQRMRSLGILAAGAAGASALSLLAVVASGVYGQIAYGSFERGVGNLWGLVVIFAVVLGAIVAGGLALLWFALGWSAGGGGPARGQTPRSGATGAGHFPPA